MRRFIPLVIFITFVAWFLRPTPWDVDLELAPQEVDTTNVAVLRLSHVLERNPGARRIRLRWLVRPDPQRPGTLAREMVYDRTTATLGYNRETGNVRYLNVTPPCVAIVATKMGAAPDLMKCGATQTKL